MYLRIILLFIFTYIFSVLNIYAVYSKDDNIKLTPKQSTSGKWGYVDISGKYKIYPQFETALNFKEGFALVSVQKKYGFIDTSGKPMILPQFDEAKSFSDGLAAVMIYDQQMDRKWGYIDKTGNFIIKPQYEDALDFSQDTAKVLINGNWKTINKSGEII